MELRPIFDCKTIEIALTLILYLAIEETKYPLTTRTGPSAASEISLGAPGISAPQLITRVTPQKQSTILLPQFSGGLYNQQFLASIGELQIKH